MSDARLIMERGKSKVSALLAMLQYVSDELASLDPISQFCVDMAIRQLSEQAHSNTMHMNIPNEDNTIQ